MNKLNIVCYLIGTLISIQATAIGGVDGGGGVGVRCPTTHGKSSLELLDLHEGRLRGLEYLHAPKSENEISDLAANLFVRHFWNPWTIPMPEYFTWLKDKVIDGILNGRGFHNYKNGKDVSITYVDSLPLSNDFGNYNIRPGCSLEQIAYYDDAKNTILFAMNPWQSLSGIDKTALITHELIYATLRDHGLEYAGTAEDGVISSEKSRQFVGSILSRNGLLPKFAGVIRENNYMSCFGVDSNSGTSFFIYNSGSNEVTAVMSLNNWFSTPFSARVSLKGVQVHDFYNGPGTFSFKAPLELSGEIAPPQFNLEISRAENNNPIIKTTRVINNVEIIIGNLQTFTCNFPSNTRIKQ